MAETEVVNIDDLVEISYKFSELGDIIEDISASNARLFDDAKDNFKMLQDTVDSLTSDTFKQLENELQAHMEHAPKLLELYDSAFSNVDNVFQSLNVSIAHLKDSIRIGEAAPPGEAPKKPGKEKKKLPKFLAREIKSAGNMIKGFAAKMKLPLAGGIVAGGMLWMAMGFRRTQRIEAEAGEVKNILVAATDATVDGMVNAATSKISIIQEDLQKTYGIARSDFQNVISTFVEGGVEIEKTLNKVGDGLGKAGENTLLYTYSLDKMFEMQGGTSAKRALQMMVDYGDDVEEATDRVVALTMAGRESGIGMNQFMKNIMTSGDEVKKWGFDIDAVADLSLTLQKHFEELGVPRQFAGRQAAIGMGQMASGLVNMSMDWQMLLAEKAGYGKGLAGRQAMREAHTRVAREGGSEELMEIYRVMAATAMDISGGDETIARQVMEQSMGIGFEGAKAAIQIMEAMETGDVVSARKIAAGQEKELRDSLTTEKEKRNQWELGMNNWLDAISMIGEGILTGITNILAQMIVWGKSIPRIIANFFMGREDENDRLLGEIEKFSSSLDSGSDAFLKGIEKGADTFKAMGMGLGENMDALKTAFTFDPMALREGKGLVGDPAGEPSPPPTPAFVSTPTPAPIVQTVVVQAPSEATAGIPEGGAVPVSTRPSAGGQFFMPQDPASSMLRIVSDGVDAVGNIVFGLKGNCPNCGLNYGGPSAESKAAIKKAGEVGKQVEFLNINTGQREALDPTTPEGMDRLSTMSKGVKARRSKAETEELDPRLGRVMQRISEKFPGKEVQVARGATEAEGKGVHARGLAMDIGVEGVPTREVFEALREDPEVGGVGYYPGRPFVHADVREGKAIWVEEEGGETFGGSKALKWLKENPSETKAPQQPRSAVAEAESVSPVVGVSNPEAAG
jgi:hypothetical protein